MKWGIHWIHWIADEIHGVIFKISNLDHGVPSFVKNRVKFMNLNHFEYSLFPSWLDLLTGVAIIEIFLVIYTAELLEINLSHKNIYPYLQGLTTTMYYYRYVRKTPRGQIHQEAGLCCKLSICVKKHCSSCKLLRNINYYQVHS